PDRRDRGFPDGDSRRVDPRPHQWTARLAEQVESTFRVGLGLARGRPDLPLRGAVLVPDPLLPSAEVLQALPDLLLEGLERSGPLRFRPLGERLVRQRRGGEPEFDALLAR